GGAAIPGATNSTYLPSVNGWYSLMITDSLGCTATTDSVFCTIVGLDQGLDGYGFTVAPNPSTGRFRLISAVPVLVPVRVALHDLTGRQLFLRAMPDMQSPVEFALEDVARGVYFLDILLENGGRKTIRLVLR
ncbi:MAG: T9SS type A sorting domain-containing protein, partial [Bacteroidota bacterium]